MKLARAMCDVRAIVEGVCGRRYCNRLKRLFTRFFDHFSETVNLARNVMSRTPSMKYKVPGTTVLEYNTLACAAYDYVLIEKPKFV